REYCGSEVGKLVVEGGGVGWGQLGVCDCARPFAKSAKGQGTPSSYLFAAGRWATPSFKMMHAFGLRIDTTVFTSTPRSRPAKCRRSPRPNSGAADEIPTLAQRTRLYGAPGWARLAGANWRNRYRLGARWDKQAHQLRLAGSAGFAKDAGPVATSGCCARLQSFSDLLRRMPGPQKDRYTTLCGGQ